MQYHFGLIGAEGRGMSRDPGWRDGTIYARRVPSLQRRRRLLQGQRRLRRKDNRPSAERYRDRILWRWDGTIYVHVTQECISCFFRKSDVKVSYPPDYASSIGSKATFSVKPPLADADSASSNFGDTFFEKEVQPSIDQT